jgi:CheY-like chemotaxis protein
LDIRKTVEVLLIEDNPADACLIKEACSGFAIKNEVAHVDNGIRALDYLYKRGEYGDSKTPNLIILDLNLPIKNGREVLKEIKNDDNLKLIPVIVLTTSSDSEDICESYRQHASVYLTKPSNFDEFDDLICSFEDFWFNKAILPTCKQCKKD